MYRLFLALRYLRSRLVNLISVGGVMAGVAVLIVVTCVMDGFQAKVRQVLRGNLSDIILVPTGATVQPYLEFDRRLKNENRGTVVATSPQVTGIVFYPYQSSQRNQLRVGDRSVLMLTAVGVDWEREREVSSIQDYLVAVHDKVRPFHHPDAVDRDDTPTVILSRTFAERFLGLGTSFELPQNLLGTLVDVVVLKLKEKGETGNGGGMPGIRHGESVEATPNVYKFMISGVYDAEDTSMDMSRIYVDRERLRKIVGIEDEYQELRVRISDPERKDVVKKSFQGRYTDFQVETWEDQRRQYLRAVNSEKVLLVIVLSFIVLLGGFIILATLTLTVVEKTKDIGVLSALGASRSGVLSMFLGNGFLIGVIGSLLGLALGYLFVANINGVKDWLADRGIHVFPPDIYLFREIPTVWSWPTVAWIVGGSISVSFFAGLLPALRAARMDPVKALRYE